MGDFFESQKNSFYMSVMFLMSFILANPIKFIREFMIKYAKLTQR